jgi:hypothetical protein
MNKTCKKYATPNSKKNFKCPARRCADAPMRAQKVHADYIHPPQPPQQIGQIRTTKFYTKRNNRGAFSFFRFETYDSTACFDWPTILGFSAKILKFSYDSINSVSERSAVRQRKQHNNTAQQTTTTT